MKQSKLVGVIKINKEVKEVQGVFNNQYVYTRVKRHREEQPTATTVEESVEVDNKLINVGMTDEEREAILNDILERAAAKAKILNKAMEDELKFKRDMEKLDRIVKNAMREERRRNAPKTRLQAAMDFVGIDRRRVYDMLCEIEKRFNM